MKTKTQWPTRMIEETRAGRTHLIEEKYPVPVPVAPIDWDLIATRAVCAFTGITVTGALVWSTVAISGLLNQAAPLWAAIAIAGVFDLAWVTCGLLEYLNRYDHTRGTLFLVVGLVTLVLSMTLITLHGGLMAHNWWAGGAGAAVSLVAKGMWTVTMRHFSVDLSERTVAWMRADREQVQVAKATELAQRSLDRMRAQTAALRAATALPGQLAPTVSVSRDAVPEPQTPPELSRDGVPALAPVLSPTVSPAVDRPSASAFVRQLVEDKGLSDAEVYATFDRGQYPGSWTRAGVKKALQRTKSTVRTP